mmetsp:Transcript_97686/g.285162  ORF Transcript_97686/g.285162 Transcript_97686/m.285162 type:complete len:748 (-) Transcript_97686:72-2315(-)
MYVRASPMAACTAAAAASDSFSVSLASATGKNSRPLRNGNSALFTLSIASSTSSAFLTPSLTYASASTRSLWSFVAASTELSFSWALRLLSTSFCREAFTAGAAPGRCEFRQVSEDFSAFCEVTTASPISLTASSGSSSPSAEASTTFWTFSTSSSALLIRSCSSEITALPLMSLEPPSAAFLCFVTSAIALFSLLWSLAMGAARSLLGSFCFVAMTFRASAHASMASFSAVPARSRASRRTSVETSSRFSEWKASQIFASAWTLPSPSAMASMRSASLAVVFRSKVSALKTASFFEASSARSMSCFSSSKVSLATSLGFLLASSSLVLTKSLAALMAVSALPAAASQSLMAFVDCSGGSTSMPFKKGVSASLHATSASSAFSAFSAACVTICCMAMPSRCRRRTWLTDSIFFLAATPRSLIWFSSSFSMPSAVRIFSSRFRSALEMAMVAGDTSFSAAATSSSDIWPCSAALDMRLAFSTSSSAASIFSDRSARALFASTRDLKLCRKVLYGFSRFCASVSFCCSVEYSESAVSCTSGAYLLAFCRLRFFCFRASMVLLCASEAAVSLSSTALFSMSCSGGSVTVGSGMAEMASLESSAMDTSSRTSGRVSAKSLASFSSDFFFRSCISACLLAAAALCCAFWTCPLTFVISAVKLACRDLALTMSLERSPTALLPAFLASSMSALSDFDTSPSMATCFTSRSRSPPPPPLEVRRLASTRASAASARRCRAAGGTPWRGWALAFLD